MDQLLYLLLLLGCPLMMVFMMRGIHGGHAGHGGEASRTVIDTTAHDSHAVDDTRDAGIAELEREVSALRTRVSAPADDRQPVGR